MRRTGTVVGIAVLAVLLAGSNAFARTVVRGYPSYGVVSITRPGRTAADERVYEKLEDTIVTFTFSDQPLAEAIDFLQVLSGENIVLDRRHVDEGKTVTLKLKDVSLKTALNFVTEQVALKWVVTDGVVVIGDEESTRQKPVTVVYDVLHLLARPPDFEGPEIDLGMMNRTESGAKEWNPFPREKTLEQPDRQKTREELTDELVEVIRATIAPESWEPAD